MTGEMNAITFAPRWREELVATADEGILIFELRMGFIHIYFPDEKRWLQLTPQWARDKWELYKNACTEWCGANRVRMSIVHDAYVYEEKAAGELP